MDELDQFDSVFGSDPSLAYNNQTVDHILRNRRSLENELFFDRLLNALGVNQGIRQAGMLKSQQTQTDNQKHPDCIHRGRIKTYALSTSE